MSDLQEKERQELEVCADNYIRYDTLFYEEQRKISKEGIVSVARKSSSSQKEQSEKMELGPNIMGNTSIMDGNSGEDFSR